MRNHLERTLLATFLWADRRFRRLTGRDRIREFGRLAAERAVALLDLSDHLWAAGEVETARHLVKIGSDGEARVIRYRRDPAEKWERRHA